jgi:Ca-activated chloride channel family protein
MRIDFSSFKVQLSVLLTVLSASAVFCLVNRDCSLLTPDQKAYKSYKSGDYVAAATQFADPMWKGAALFLQGDFKQAAGIFAGYDTAPAAFNHGNALVMLGKYEDAVGRYSRALELDPGWDDAAVNLEIARARADMLKKEGGDMTGGKMGADEIVFSKGKSPPSAGEEVVEGAADVSDADMQAVWLRNVQTKPADFLQSKFAYQHAMGKQKKSEGTPASVTRP